MKKGSPKGSPDRRKQSEGILLPYVLKDRFTDIILIADDPTKFSRCHRLILSAGSTYFDTLFLHDQLRAKECKDDSVVVIPTLTNDILLLILSFIYTEQVKVPRSQILSFSKAAALLGLDRLHRKEKQFFAWCQDHSDGKPNTPTELLGVKIVPDGAPACRTATALAEAQIKSIKTSSPGKKQETSYKTPSKPIQTGNGELQSPSQFWIADDTEPMPMSLPLNLTMEVGDEELNQCSPRPSSSRPTSSGSSSKKQDSSEESITDSIECCIRAAMSASFPSEPTAEERRKAVLAAALAYYETSKSISGTLAKYPVPKSTLTKHIYKLKKAAGSSESSPEATEVPSKKMKTFLLQTERECPQPV